MNKTEEQIIHEEPKTKFDEYMLKIGEKDKLKMAINVLKNANYPFRERWMAEEAMLIVLNKVIDELKLG